MHKLCLVIAFALLSHEALGFKIKRQTEKKEEDLEDRYGWNRPSFPNPGQWQWQGRYPNEGQWTYPGLPYPGNFPWQFPGATQRPDQFPGQQFPGFPGLQIPGVNPGQTRPGQDPAQTPIPNQTTTPAPNSGSTTQSVVVQDCLRTCLVTPEYNPVCGSDSVTYDNPGRLLCAQSCGVSVTQVRASRCPNAVLPPVA